MRIHVSLVTTIALLLVAHTSFATANECPARTTTKDAADCVERGIYQPCELGSSVGIADCAWAYVEVENRKIGNLEKEILSVFKSRRLSGNAATAFARWQADWRRFRETSCRLSDHLAEIIITGQHGIVSNGTDFHRGFCLRRLNENRVSELTRFLEIAKANE